MELNGIDRFEEPKTHPLTGDEDAGTVEEVATANKTWAITSAEATILTTNDLAKALFSSSLLIGSEPVAVKANLFPAEAILLYFATHKSPLARTDHASRRVEERRRAARQLASEKRREDEKAARKQSPRAHEIKIFIPFSNGQHRDQLIDRREIRSRT